MSAKELKLVPLERLTNAISKSHKGFESKLDYEFFQNFESACTKKAYKNDIRQFFSFIKNYFADLSCFNEIERVHIIAYKNWLSESDYAPKTINRRLSAVSSYFDFLVEKNLMEFNPANSIKRPRQEVVHPTNDLSDEEINKLLVAMDEERGDSAPLHRAIVYLFFATGIRKSELINIKRKDLKKINDHTVIEIRAKGGKFLTKVVHPKCAEIIQDYLGWMKSLDRDIHIEDWLFQPTKNPIDANLARPLSPASIDYIIEKYVKKIGVEKKISAHSARASYIGSALENGMDLYAVSQDVGHSSVKTTQEYNKRRQKLENSPTFVLPFLKNDN